MKALLFIIGTLMFLGIYLLIESLFNKDLELGYHQFMAFGAFITAAGVLLIVYNKKKDHG